jgi:hypothetical protein
MTPESRYGSSEQLFVAAHAYDEVGKTAVDDSSDTPIVNGRQAIYRLTELPLPDPPPQSTRAKVTSYLHLYANDLYGDAEKWWMVAEANPHIRYPLDLKMNDLVYLP